MTDDITTMADRLKSWERLRVVYNAVMLAIGIPIAISLYSAIQALPPHYEMLKHHLDANGLIGRSIALGLLANVCYCLGPLAEIYTLTFTSKKVTKRFRYVVFGLGTLVSVGTQVAIWFLVSVFVAFEVN